VGRVGNGKWEKKGGGYTKTKTKTRMMMMGRVCVKRKILKKKHKCNFAEGLTINQSIYGLLF
jgi:hypothetical protein